MTVPPPIAAMCVTPFDDDGNLDDAALAQVVEFLAASGVAVYLGSYGTGEGQLLTEDEVRRVYAIGVGAAAGRVPVYAAALGFTDTARVIDRALEAVAAGVDAVQIHPPRPGPAAITMRAAEIERFFADVLGAVQGAVHISSQVVMTGYPVPAELVEDLLESYANIVAVNVSDPDIGRVSQLLRRTGARTAVRVGLIAQLPMALLLGAAGALCFEADIDPRLCLDVVDAHRANDRAKLETKFSALMRLNEVLTRYGNPRSVKAAMRLTGLPAGRCRRPYLDLTPDEEANIRGTLGRLQNW